MHYYLMVASVPSPRYQLSPPTYSTQGRVGCQRARHSTARTLHSRSCNAALCVFEGNRAMLLERGTFMRVITSVKPSAGSPWQKRWNTCRQLAVGLLQVAAPRRCRSSKGSGRGDTTRIVAAVRFGPVRVLTLSEPEPDRKYR